MVVAIVSMTLHAVLFVVLTGICAFDDGRPTQWRDCILPLALLALPLAFALVGARTRRGSWLLAACVSSLALAVVTLTGAGLALLLLAILYGVAADVLRRDAAQSTR